MCLFDFGRSHAVEVAGCTKKYCSIYDLTIGHSNAGYYIGTKEKDGSPYCRISGYYPTRDLAENTLMAHRQSVLD